MSRIARTFLGLFLLYTGGSALLDGDGRLLMWLLVVLGIVALSSSRRSDSDRSAAADSPARSQSAPAPRRRQSRSRPHADRAVRNAGHDPTDLALNVSDIGVFAIREGRNTLVHRQQGIRDDVDYIQPWVALRLPGEAAGTVRFELRDAEDRLCFYHDRSLTLGPGENLVSSAARMPVHDALLTDGAWQLAIYADRKLLAAHNFAWVEADDDHRLRAHLREDGEMSDALRQSFAESSQEQGQSLDELLDFQQGR